MGKRTWWWKHVHRLRRRLPQPLERLAKRMLVGSLDRPRDEAIFRAHLRQTDVFLVGHPKSGNTWLAYMLAILMKDGDPEGEVTMANVGDFVPTIHERDSSIRRHERSSRSANLS